MTAPVHYAVGAASALLIQNYLSAKSSRNKRIAWALGIAIVSHIAMEAIPHSEHFLKGWYLALELVVETLVTLGVLVGVARSPLVAAIILAGMAGAAIPDGFTELNHYIGLPALSWVDNKMHMYHGKFHLFYANLFLQLVITVLCSIYVRVKSAA